MTNGSGPAEGSSANRKTERRVVERQNDVVAKGNQRDDATRGGVQADSNDNQDAGK